MSSSGERSSPSRFTTHDLAVLFETLGLAAELGSARLSELARAREWIAHRLRLPCRDWRASMRNVKNCAYAWRQMLFFLSFVDDSALAGHVEWAQAEVAKQPRDLRARFEPVVAGLRLVAAGERFDADGRHGSGARRLLG